MEPNMISEEQQVLKKDCHQIIKQKPIHEIEITTDTLNTQQVLREVHEEVTEERNNTIEDELEDMQLSKSREYNSQSLICRLRYEAELLAKAKAREEFTVCTLQSHIQEVQENKDQLDKDVVQLQNYKEKLLRKLEVGHINRCHIEKQMKNTGKIVEMLNENYKGLDKTYQTTLEATKSLEQISENLFQNYQEKKEKLLTAIKVEDEKLKEIEDMLDADNKQYNVALNNKNDNLMKLKEYHVKVTNEIENMNKICNDLKGELNEGHKNLNEAQSQNQSLKNLINTINLEELEAQNLEKQRNYQEVLNAFEEDLAKTKESCDAAEERKGALLLSLNSEVKIENKLAQAYDELENDHSALITHQEELNKINGVIEVKANNICSLELEIEANDDRLAKLTEEVIKMVENRKEMVVNLNVIQETTIKCQAKMDDLKNQTQKLIEDYDQNVPKLLSFEQQQSDLKIEIGNVSSQLLDAKEKYLNAEKKYNAEFEEVDEKLIETQKILEQTKQEYEMNANAARAAIAAYKAETEKIAKENGQNKQNKLQELEGQLNSVQNKFTKEQEMLEQTKNKRKEKDLTLQKLQLQLERAKLTSSQQYLQRRTVPDNIKPSGILKSPGKSPPTPKSVSWRVPSNSSFDSDVGQRDWRTTDELFNELLGMTPPERLGGPKSRKRPRFDQD